MPTPAQPRASRVLLWVGLLVLYLVWGSTYLGIRIAVDTIPPFVMAATRFLTGGLALFAWSILREGRSFAWPSGREWRDMLIVGALLLGGGMGLVAWGEQTVPSGIAALLIAMMPVWVAVLGRVFLGERLPRLAVAGIAVGLAGVAILVGGPDPADRLDPAGVVALIVSPLCWSAGSLYAAHRVPQSSRPLVATAMQMLCGSAVLAGMAIATGEPGRLRVDMISTSSLVALAYLTVVGSLLAFSTYVWLLRVAPLPLIATYAYVNPVVAVVLGAIVLGETLTPTKLLAGGVIVFAVALIITARGRMRRPTVGAAADGLPAPQPGPVRPLPAADR
ncbi:MAG TPA: EamA family transporter [Candidatus Limnocylindrales bacterium]|jgi:drug/metabolite transporter (DMT)-like permease|nr:EamA family transporter [Candidatus Limnocylindrales bacterium]